MPSHLRKGLPGGPAVAPATGDPAGAHGPLAAGSCCTASHLRCSLPPISAVRGLCPGGWSGPRRLACTSGAGPHPSRLRCPQGRCQCLLPLVRESPPSRLRHWSHRVAPATGTPSWSPAPPRTPWHPQQPSQGLRASRLRCLQLPGPWASAGPLVWDPRASRLRCLQLPLAFSGPGPPELAQQGVSPKRAPRGVFEVARAPQRVPGAPSGLLRAPGPPSLPQGLTPLYGPRYPTIPWPSPLVPGLVQPVPRFPRSRRLDHCIALAMLYPSTTAPWPLPSRQSFAWAMPKAPPATPWGLGPCGSLGAPGCPRAPSAGRARSSCHGPRNPRSRNGV